MTDPVEITTVEDYSNDGTFDFTNYVETTITPGWYFTIGVTLLFFLLHCCLPCYVTIGKRVERHRRRQQSQQPGSGTTSNLGTKESPTKTNRANKHHLKKMKEEEEKDEITNTNGTTNDYNHSVPSPTHNKIVSSNGDVCSVMSRSSSLISKTSTGSGAVSTVFSALIEARPNVRHGGRHHHHHRRIHQKRTTHSFGVTTSSSSLSPNNSDTHCTQSTHSSPNNVDNSDFDAIPLNHTYSYASGESNASSTLYSPSLLMERGRTKGHHPRSHVDSSKQHNVNNHYRDGSNDDEIMDLCCGTNAWYKPKMLLYAFDQILTIAEWDKEMSKLYNLAIPLTIQGSLEGIFDVIAIALLGRFIGIREANAYIVVSMLNEFTNTINYGFYEALGTIGPHAEGAGNYKLVGQTFQLSLVLYIVFSIPMLLIWVFYTKDAILWFGFDMETAMIGQEYANVYVVMELLFGIDDCLHQVLDFSGHEYYSTVVQTINEALFAVAIVVVKFTFPASNDDDTGVLFRIGILQLILTILMTTTNYMYVILKGWLDAYWEGLFHSCSFLERKPVINMLRTAIPLSISWIFTYGEWEVLTIFASFMGPAEVAAFGILGSIWSLFEYLAEGIADVAELRVGYHMGNGKPDRAKSSAFKSIFIALFLSIASTSILYIIGIDLVHWVTPDPTLQRMIFDLIPLIGIGQIGLTFGTIFLSLIGAQGRYHISTMIEIITSWFIVIPLAAIFVLLFNLNLQGLAAAMILGYAFGGTVNCYIVLLSDWAQLSDLVVERNKRDAHEGQDDKEDDDDECVERAGNANVDENNCDE